MSSQRLAVAMDLSNANAKTQRLKLPAKSPEEMLLSRSWTLSMISGLMCCAWDNKW